MSVSLMLMLLLSITRCNEAQVPFLFTGVELANCATISTTVTEVSNLIHCTLAIAKELKLSNLVDVTINSVTYTKKPSSLVDALCKKVSASPIKYEINIKKDVKNIIYTHDNKIKAILVGADKTGCFQDILLKNDEIKKGYLQIETIGCYPTEKVKVLTNQSGTAIPLVFPTEDSKTCFLAPMLLQPVQVEFNLGTEKIKVILSAYPKKECAPCQSLSPTAAPKSQ